MGTIYRNKFSFYEFLFLIKVIPHLWEAFNIDNYTHQHLGFNSVSGSPGVPSTLNLIKKMKQSKPQVKKKMKKTDKKWYEKPYSQTEVSVQKTIFDIEKLLTKYGIEGFQKTHMGNFIQIRFIIIENGQQIPFQFDIQLPKEEQDQGTRKQMQYMRAYYYYIKARLETIIDFNIKPFSEEFMAERILKLPNNQLRTIGQIVKDQAKRLDNGNNLYLPLKEG